MFSPPEGDLNLDALKPMLSDSESSLSAWDVAVRFHDFKKTPVAQKDSKLRDHVKSISIEAILAKANQIRGRTQLPQKTTRESGDFTLDNETFRQLDLDETIESNPLLNREDFVYEVKSLKPRGLILTLDTSLSMTGEKLALEAVALALVHMEYASYELALIAFENEPAVLLSPQEKISTRMLLERFLDVKAQGYTHLEKALKHSLTIQDEFKKTKHPDCILLSDGKYTAGRDPTYLAPQFLRLEVIRVGKDKAGTALCQGLADKGHGKLHVLANLEEVPVALYDLTRSLKYRSK